MKTNFEKWKETLTPEWVAAFMQRYSIHCGCYECPAEWYHKHGEAKGRNGCSEVFLEWANAPAKEEGEPKSKFPIGHPLHMSTEEMKAADTALFIQTEGRMGKDWRNAEEKKEPPLLIYEENGEKTPCPKCGEPANIIKNAPKIYCKHCADFYPREEYL